MSRVYNKHLRLVAGETVGEWLLVRRYKKNRVTYWECRCSCSTESDPQVNHIAEGNLKAGVTHRCREHKRRLVTALGFRLPAVTLYLRHIRDKMPVVAEWCDSLTFTRECLAKKPKESQHNLKRIDKTKPLGPDNFRWVPNKKPIRSEEAREELARLIGDRKRAFSISTQRVYLMLKKLRRKF